MLVLLFLCEGKEAEGEDEVEVTIETDELRMHMQVTFRVRNRGDCGRARAVTSMPWADV